MGFTNQDRFTRDEVYEASLRYYAKRLGNEEQAKLPADVFTDKYALRDRDGNFYELTPTDMHHRLAREFARIEAKYPNPMSQEYIFRLMEDGYVGPQGSPMFGIGNDFQLVSLSNCSVLPSPKDTMSSIMETGRDMANLYKRRFGVGVDISELRPAGASVNNAAVTSTGAWSFADLYSYITRMVGQQGRRGALMITMDVRHPDIEKFITMKDDLTKVTGANVSVKVTDEFMEAVEKDEEFVLRWPVEAPTQSEALFDANGFALRPVAKVERAVRARDIFKLIAAQANKNAEPGLLFWDTIKRNLPLDFYPGFETISTNPCGELPLCAYDSCRLISLYLVAFVRDAFTDKAYFDWDKFEEVVEAAQRLMDDLVDLEIEKLIQMRDRCDTADERAMFEAFIAKCEQGRRTGLGTHGLADALAQLGIRYDSETGIRTASNIYRVLATKAYESSVQMAEERGAFPIFNWETEKDCAFFEKLPGSLVYRMKRVGRRNGAILTNAPTGSRSIMSDNCSSGIEPVFLNSYNRKRKIDRAKENITPDHIDAMGDAWVSYKIYHPNVERYLWKQYTESAYSWFTFEGFKQDATLPDYFVTSADIDYLQRVRMQAAITEYIDHSVSSTLNLPSTSTPDDVARIYMEAWKLGCKGVTVYRDGSREAQVLSAELPKTEPGRVEPEPVDLEALRAELVEEIREELAAEQQGHPNRPVETTGGMFKASFTNPVDGEERKVYVFIGKNDDRQPVEAFVIDTQGPEDFRPYAEALGRLTSLALKFNVPVEDIVTQLEGLKGGSVSYTEGVHQSVPALLAKQLRAAQEEFENAEPAVTIQGPITVPEGTVFKIRAGEQLRFADVVKTADDLKLAFGVPAKTLIGDEGIPGASKCPSCKQKTLVTQGGCPTCVQCGFAKCS